MPEMSSNGDAGPSRLVKGRGVDLDRMTIPELRALIAEIETKVREKQGETKAALLAKWRQEAEESGLTLDAVLPGAGDVGTKQARMARKGEGKKLLVKYRGPNPGEEWSGRGRLPKWLQVAEAEGKNRADFKV